MQRRHAHQVSLTNLSVLLPMLGSLDPLMQVYNGSGDAGVQTCSFLATASWPMAVVLWAMFCFWVNQG
jgi:hypothetical protein